MRKYPYLPLSFSLKKGDFHSLSLGISAQYTISCASSFFNGPPCSAQSNPETGCTWLSWLVASFCCTTAAAAAVDDDDDDGFISTCDSLLSVRDNECRCFAANCSWTDDANGPSKLEKSWKIQVRSIYYFFGIDKGHHWCLSQSPNVSIQLVDIWFVSTTCCHPSSSKPF